MSQVIRQAGYSLTDAEAAYLDAEQQLQFEWVAPLWQVVTLAGTESGLPDASTQAAIRAELEKLLAMDPTAGPAAPPQYQRLRELAVAQRQALQRAARAWLAALQAGDPDWRQRGADDAQAAQRALEEWAAEMVARYPPPAQPGAEGQQ
ncbi:MAG TPA: hypothetical protein VKZ60_17115 [Chloroflexota bacterium]|nr:hypothetical protein [Chloroflexota bacterium]